MLESWERERENSIIGSVYFKEINKENISSSWHCHQGYLANYFNANLHKEKKFLGSIMAAKRI